MDYRIKVFAMDANFGPGALVAELNEAMNVGWADYLLDVPEAFFTLAQDDPKVQLLRPYIHGNAHVRIYRDTDLVWGGILGEWDANENDAIFMAYGYLALFYVLIAGWNTVYTNQQIDAIVSPEYDYHVGKTNSIAKWLTKGTIEAPVTTSGGGTAIVLPTYRMYYKRYLFMLRELAGLSIGDTTNTVVFEVTPSGTFNFWKNRGVDVDVTYRYGDGLVAGFGDSTVPVFRRNDLLTVGINPNSVTLKEEILDATDAASYGLRQEPMFFSWVRDSLELDRVGKIRAQKAKRDVVDLSLKFHPGSVIPPRATGAPFKLADRVKIVIDWGITNVNGPYLVKGVQVLYVGGQERVRLMVEQRSGV